MILIFRTDKSRQTVETQIRLLLRVFTVCYSIYIFLTKYLKVWPLFLNFRCITAKFSGVRKFRNFTVVQDSMNSKFPNLKFQILVIFYTGVIPNESGREKTGFLHMRKQRRRSASRLLSAKLISAFVFAILIVQFLYYLNPKFPASSHLLWRYSLVCVGPGRKP